MAGFFISLVNLLTDDWSLSIKLGRTWNLWVKYKLQFRDRLLLNSTVCPLLSWTSHGLSSSNVANKSMEHIYPVALERKRKEVFLEQWVCGGGLPLGFPIQLQTTQLHSGVSQFGFNEFLMPIQPSGRKRLLVNAGGTTLRQACSRLTGNTWKALWKKRKRSALKYKWKPDLNQWRLWWERCINNQTLKD